MGSRVAKRYARALLELSADRAQLEAWGAELEHLAQVAAAPEIATALASPQLSFAARIEAIGRIAERLGLSYPLRSFAVVVARHGRIAEFTAISRAYQDLIDERLGRARASLTFARQPSDEEVASVAARLEAIAGKTIIPTVKVDESLLGGVVAELEGKIYDGSLATQLAQAQRRMSQ
jgi:F-type H+-transporting ATPase subunit delta